MGHLTDPGQLGSGIATAFVATIYGVGFASILFLPVAHKLRAIILQQVLDKELLAEGILALSQGRAPSASNPDWTPTCTGNHVSQPPPPSAGRA